MRRPLLRQSIQTAFPDISDHEASQLIAIGEVRAYPPDTVLCREGNIEDTFYLILEGEVLVSKIINQIREHPVKPLQAGDFFGEYALIHDAPRTATVITSQPTTVLEIRRADFNQLLKQSASMSIAMVRHVSRRLQENDQMAIEDLRLKAGELATAYQRLAEMEYARREFLTSVAHELRTPLTSASGFLQLIQLGILQGDELNSGLITIEENLQRIVVLVNDILFLQEMDLILQAPKRMDVCAMVAENVEALRGPAQKQNVYLTLDISPHTPLLMGDRDSLERGLKAILENAIKFSPDGGDVEVAVGQNEEEVWIKVQDHGVGIAEDVKPHIFNRFFHLDRIGDHVFGGLGLGLAIAHQVVQQHEGRITVESEPGRGSTFTVWLKKSPEE
ncbi:MAG: cyclic nucleotide-binding domain-containing protein [Anaerolineales bacterium]|nr:cyclic nucleotide-binding domain-containing protein [Anaerolineales bacterium]